MSYIGPIDEDNLRRLEELSDHVHSIRAPEPFRNYRYLIDTIIGEWQERGKRIAELERELTDLRAALYGDDEPISLDAHMKHIGTFRLVPVEDDEDA